VGFLKVDVVKTYSLVGLVEQPCVFWREREDRVGAAERCLQQRPACGAANLATELYNYPPITP
jgi:hypothetical protein